MSTTSKISGTTRQVVFVVLIVLLVRIALVDLYQWITYGGNGISFYDSINIIFNDYLATGLLVVSNVCFVVVLGRIFDYGQRPTARLLLLSAYVLVMSIFITLIVNREIVSEQGVGTLFANGVLWGSFLAGLTINALVVVLFDLIAYVHRSTTALKSERRKKRKAQYQYLQIKQQLNSHFLFNSLNMLEYLVGNGENERASDYIRKLAGVYRYTLNKEGNSTVPLIDEIKFVELYTDLLMERFVGGLNVIIDIPPCYLLKHTIPCGLQMLVENAVKHNVVEADKPLMIKIYIEGERLVVVNNLQPRLTTTASTRVGLKYIRKQYLDIMGQSIMVEQIGNNYSVSLPLI